MEDLTPKRFHVVEVEKLPPCDVCGSAAVWDAKTWQGPWAWLCDDCVVFHAAQPRVTGVGVGQRLIVKENA